MLAENKPKRKKSQMRRSPFGAKLITIREAAERLRIDPVSIYKGKAGTGELKTVTVRRGRKQLIPITAVENLIIHAVNQGRRGKNPISIWDDQLITAQEAAELLLIAPVSVYMGAAGTAGLTHVRFGRRVLFLKSEVERLARW